jgi:hypothetical protein
MGGALAQEGMGKQLMRNAAIAVTATVLMISGCAGPSSVQDARGQVDAFHALLDKGDFDSIWNDATQDIKATTSKESFTGLLTAVHARMGTAKETKQVGWKVNTDTAGTFASVTMQTSFERGSAQEEFIYRKTDAGYKLAGYQIKADEPAAK